MENLQDTRFICELCDKVFANKANLKRHQETHEERKVCLKCGATFSTNDRLKSHNKSQHEAVGIVPQIHQSLASPNAPSNDSLNSTSKSNTLAAVSNNFFSTSGHQPASLFLPTKPPTMQSATIASEINSPVAKTPVPPKKVKTFANPQQLPKHDKEKHLDFDVGDRISTPTNKHGTLRYKGDVDFAPGMWAGVELDTPTGKNDGSTKHKRYFQCLQKHGLFLPVAKLTKLQGSTMIQDRIDSGNLHVHVSTPKNTAQHVRVDTTGVTTSLFASGPAQSITGSSNSLSQKSPSQAKKRSAPLRCNHCEGCERNQKGDDCGECRYCKDKAKYGGPNTLRKPCEKRKCTVKTRPSVKDDDIVSQPKRTFSESAHEDLSARQGPSMKKKKKGDTTDLEDKFTLKLEKKYKKAEKEKQCLEKSLIQARASANRFKTERDEMGKENASIKEQIPNLQQELQQIKEIGCIKAEEKLKVQKEKLENQMRSLEAEKTHIYQQMTQIVDVKHKMEKELSELKTNKEMMDREIAKLKTCNDNMLREITDMKIDKDKMEEIFDQTKTVMLKELQSTRQGNEKLLKDKSELQSLREENKRLKQRSVANDETPATFPGESVPFTSYSGTYCDNCDVTDHDIEDCLELISENLSPDRLAEIEYAVVSRISTPVIAPVPVPLAKTDTLPLVYFDLETTGLQRQSHITQIAAKNTAGHIFDRYVIPKIPISSGAAKATRNTIINGQFYHKDRPVLAITISQALREFFFFIGDSPVILIGHNIKIFDCHVLLNAVKSCGMQVLFEKKVAGFLDTIPLFRCHTTPPFNQEKLYKRLIGGTYDAHNAIEDVKALQKLIDKINPSPEESRKHTFKVQYILDVQEYRKKAAFNLIGWKLLIEKGVITQNMAAKAAKSGLRPEHLELSFKNGGEDAVYSVLSETLPSGYRVTNNRDISRKISDYFENRLLENFGQTIKYGKYDLHVEEQQSGSIPKTSKQTVSGEKTSEGNVYNYKSLDEFEFRQNSTADFGVSCP